MRPASRFTGQLIAVGAGATVTDPAQEPTRWVAFNIITGAGQLKVTLTGWDQQQQGIAASPDGWLIIAGQWQRLPGNFGDIKFHNTGASNVSVMVTRAY